MRHFCPSCVVLIAVVVSSIFSCDKAETSGGGTTGGEYQLQPAFSGLRFNLPTGLEPAIDGTRRVFVISQPGQILAVQDTPTASSAKTFLDIRSRVIYGGEMGLLGFAFHPGYASNGYIFVCYTAPNPLRSVVSRFTLFPGNPDSVDPASEMVFLTQDQPYQNHNGGQVRFGPDGFLYVSLGDGGSAGDPQNHAQDLSSLLGKILRIDVNSPSGGRPYSIPPTNPFPDSSRTIRQEIYAYGLRNAWRFSFDPRDGTLWAGDVGQNAWEEIDVVENGGNYGWRVVEGNHCYNPSSNCDMTGFIPPVWEYPHATDECSVTGGYVYRGAALPGLFGKYVYGDYCSGRIWALLNEPPLPAANTLLLDAPFNISSFGIDTRGEICICSYVDGVIYRLVQKPSGG